MGIEEIEKNVLLHVKVTPGARQNQIVGWKNGVLKIKVSAQPEKGEANLAVIALLSQAFQIPKKNILLVRGATSRNKLFCLEGIMKADLEIFPVI